MVVVRGFCILLDWENEERLQKNSSDDQGTVLAQPPFFEISIDTWFGLERSQKFVLPACIVAFLHLLAKTHTR